jgi:adenylate cyclase
MTADSGTVVGAALFTDLVGFTEYNDAVGDVAALHVLEAQTALASAAIAGQPASRIVKELGDGLLMWFDAAADALHTAVELMSAIDAARATGDVPLSMRMGIHHGEAVVRGDDLVGQTINIASRVCDIAGPGEILASAAVIAACPVAVPFDLRPVGPVVVKGVSTPIWLHRVEASTG